jgi:uncharacterized paraquat-inducible protein A
MGEANEKGTELTEDFIKKIAKAVSAELGILDNKIKCPECHGSIKEGVEKCPHCGIKLEWEEED